MCMAYRASLRHILKKVTVCFSSSVCNIKWFQHLHFQKSIQLFLYRSVFWCLKCSPLTPESYELSSRYVIFDQDQFMDSVKHDKKTNKQTNKKRKTKQNKNTQNKQSKKQQTKQKQKQTTPPKTKNKNKTKQNKQTKKKPTAFVLMLTICP